MAFGEASISELLTERASWVSDSFNTLGTTIGVYSEVDAAPIYDRLGGVKSYGNSQSALRQIKASIQHSPALETRDGGTRDRSDLLIVVQATEFANNPFNPDKDIFVIDNKSYKVDRWHRSVVTVDSTEVYSIGLITK